MTKFTGVFPALVTPFSPDGTVNKDALKRLINKNIAEGVAGFYVSGSTGEAYLLTHEERKKLAETVMAAVAGRLPVIVNIGSISQEQSLDMALHAKSLGVAAISAVAPFYFPFSMREIKDYFLRLQARAGMPLVIYNIPGMSGVTFATADLVELLSHDGIVGIKQTTPDLFQTETLVRKCPEKSVFNGYDETFLAALSLGVEAMIGSTAGIMAEKFNQIQAAYRAGNNEEALRVQRVVNSVMEKLVSVGIFKGVKAVLRLQGIDCGDCRQPFQPLDAQALGVVAAAFEEMNR